MKTPLSAILLPICPLLVVFGLNAPVLAESVTKKAPAATDRDFYQAAKHGDAPRVAYWLARGIDLNAVDGQGNTALVYASAQGYPEVVKLLIAHQVDLDEIGGQWTALMAAAYHGHRKIVEMLVAAGATLELKNPYGRTALAYAVFNNQLATAEALLMGGADVNHALADAKMSPLILAARKANPGMVTLLLASGAEVNYQDTAAHSALFYATLKQHIPTMTLLVDAGAELDQRDSQGHTLLTRLARAGRPEVFAWLVKRGADVNLSYKGQTPLQVASYAGNADVVKYLLASTPPEQQAKAFLETAAGGSLKTLQVFLDAGLNVNSTDNLGVTALMTAAKHRDKRLVTYLIRKGADLNKQDSQGRTALMYALEAEPVKLSVVRSLVRNGADVELVDRAGHDAVQRLQSLPQGSGAEQLRSLITKAEKKLNRPLGFLSN